MKFSVLPAVILALGVGLPAFADSQGVRVYKEVVTDDLGVTQEREVIVQPPPVTREIIVQAPGTSRELIVQREAIPARSCAYGRFTYFDGGMSCQGGNQYRCVEGVWVGQNMM